MTVILRRIDHLGRIVIPKEIRDSMRLHDGDKLEIISENDNITLKKQASNILLGKLAQSILDFVQKYINEKIIITNRDVIIAITNNLNLDLINKNISAELSRRVEEHKFMDMPFLASIVDFNEKHNLYIEPVIKNGELEGMVVLIDDKNEEKNINTIKSVSKLLTTFI